MAIAFFKPVWVAAQLAGTPLSPQAQLGLQMSFLRFSAPSQTQTRNDDLRASPSVYEPVVVHSLDLNGKNEISSSTARFFLGGKRGLEGTVTESISAGKPLLERISSMIGQFPHGDRQHLREDISRSMKEDFDGFEFYKQRVIALAEDLSKGEKLSSIRRELQFGYLSYAEQVGVATHLSHILDAKEEWPGQHGHIANILSNLAVILPTGPGVVNRFSVDLEEMAPIIRELAILELQFWKDLDSEKGRWSMGGIKLEEEARSEFYRQMQARLDRQVAEFINTHFANFSASRMNAFAEILICDSRKVLGLEDHLSSSMIVSALASIGRVLATQHGGTALSRYVDILVRRRFFLWEQSEDFKTLTSGLDNAVRPEDRDPFEEAFSTRGIGVVKSDTSSGTIDTYVRYDPYLGFRIAVGTPDGAVHIETSGGLVINIGAGEEWILSAGDRYHIKGDPESREFNPPPGALAEPTFEFLDHHRKIENAPSGVTAQFATAVKALRSIANANGGRDLYGFYSIVVQGARMTVMEYDPLSGACRVRLEEGEVRRISSRGDGQPMVFDQAGEQFWIDTDSTLQLNNHPPFSFIAPRSEESTIMVAEADGTITKIGKKRDDEN